MWNCNFLVDFNFTCRHAVASAIVEMSSHVVSEKHVEWLKVIPLVNLLRRRNLKIGSLHEEDPKRISWNTVMNLHGARLDILRTKTHLGYVISFYQNCSAI